MFEVGKEYRRRTEIHSKFKGQAQGGISTPKEYPVIFLFTSDQGEQHGYIDHFHSDGTFRYTGEGQVGDMKMEAGNKAIRDHKDSNKVIHFFEYTRRAYVRYLGEAEYITHHEEQRPDREGNIRKVIVFHMDINSACTNQLTQGTTVCSAKSLKDLSGKSIDELRIAAIEKSSNTPSTNDKVMHTYYRSEAIKLYVKERAKGKCEGCNKPAPFIAKKGPYLECHHLYRLSDGGPDHPNNVVALCPNCHRMAHFSLTAKSFNEQLIFQAKQAENIIRQLNNNKNT
ncbi:HNH endonuclease [Kistimonas asteriae]|uniref:HNH endonuclease n=1 Tax=Kistimonas asteriae TaxID=517724 RepID=UPI001FE4B4CB|nr:HNH endonuclease signature motif containing protein [Kistimonas asteriae]